MLSIALAPCATFLIGGRPQPLAGRNILIAAEEIRRFKSPSLQ